jgi:hypothetical protein
MSVKLLLDTSVCLYQKNMSCITHVIVNKERPFVVSAMCLMKLCLLQHLECTSGLGYPCMQSIDVYLISF